MSIRRSPAARRRLPLGALCALALCPLLQAPAAAAATPQFSAGAYWSFADRTMTGLDGQWDPGAARTSRASSSRRARTA